MSWFSGMFRDEQRASRLRPSSNSSNDESAFQPSEESLRIFDELKNEQDNKQSDLGFRESKPYSFGTSQSVGKKTIRPGSEPNDSLLPPRTSKPPTGVQGRKKYFADLDFGNCRRDTVDLLPSDERSGLPLPRFRPSQESLRIFWNLTDGVQRKRVGRLSRKRKSSNKRFDPLQTRRDRSEMLGPTTNGTRLYRNLATPAQPAGPLPTEAVEWAMKVKAFQKTLRNDAPSDFSKSKQEEIPPQLRSHFPSVASGNVIAWEADEQAIKCLRRELHLKHSSPKKNGLFNSVQKVGEAIANRLGALVHTLWSRVEGVERSFLSFFLKTLPRDR